MRYLLRLLALGVALTLAWLGLGTSSEQTWRLYLAGVALALLLALWPGRRATWQGLMGGFVLAVLLLLLWPGLLFGEPLLVLLLSLWTGPFATLGQILMGGMALALLLPVLWPGQQDPREVPLGHNVRLLGTLLLAVATLLGLQLLRLQVLHAQDVRHRVANLPDGELVADTRPALAERRTRRGHIYDRDGAILAETQSTPEGWARRTYPRDDLGQIVGFYNPLYGNFGLENRYDDYLAGRVGTDPWGIFLEGLLHRPHVGNDLYLTLDSDLQQVAEESLGGRPGAVALLDTRTGAVLALASYPRFDPRPMVFDPAADDWEAERSRIAAYWQQLSISSTSPLLNRAISGLYPPGSTFKTLTAAAALDSDLITAETVITCPNELVVTGHTIVNFMENLSQSMERQDVLEDYIYSCNTAFAQIGLLVGADRYSEYATAFGLSYRDLPPPDWLVFDLPTAVSTIAHSRSFLDRETGLADTAYGQGELQVTPLQAALLAATIANDGMMLQPYLVERVEDPAGQVLYQAQVTPLSIPIGARTARTLRRMMVAVVDHGTGRWWEKIEGVQVAGKTGSAESGSGEPHAWFLAFAPADAPRFAVAVIVEHGGHGSEVAAPIARAVLNAALKQ